MAQISSEGLAQEQRVLAELCTVNKARLESRGLTEQKLQEYAALVAAMEGKRAGSDQTNSQKKQLTIREADQREKLFTRIRGIQHGVKNAFAPGSPQYKEFHVGDKVGNSTPAVVGWANDIASAWEKYKEAISAKSGIIQKDIDDLKADVALLTATDTEQEVAKTKGRPEATAAMYEAMEDVEAVADYIHTAARAEFGREPEVVGQFERARRLRFQTPPRTREEAGTAASSSPSAPSSAGPGQPAPSGQPGG